MVIFALPQFQRKTKSLKYLTLSSCKKISVTDHGNLSTGIWHGKEKTEQYIKGANSD